MKRFLIVFLLAISSIAYGQNNSIRFGIHAGWNYSNVNAVDEKGDASGYLSNGGEVYGGIVLEKELRSKSYIQLRALVSYTDRVTFIEMPVYYKYNFYHNFSVFAGPKLDYIPDSESSQPYNFRRRLGISGDLGVDYKISGHFTIEGSFSKGFTKQYDDLVLGYFEARRDVYRIGVTYFFN